MPPTSGFVLFTSLCMALNYVAFSPFWANHFISILCLQFKNDFVSTLSFVILFLVLVRSLPWPMLSGSISSGHSLGQSFLILSPLVSVGYVINITTATFSSQKIPAANFSLGRPVSTCWGKRFQRDIGHIMQRVPFVRIIWS